MGASEELEVHRGGARPAAIEAFPDGRLAWTLDDFCLAYNISRTQWYELQRAGAGPRTLKIGVRVMVTPEAVRDWKRQRELGDQAAPPQAEKRDDRNSLIRAYLDASGRDVVTTQEILEKALGLAPGAWTLGEMQRIGRLLKALRWRRVRVSSGWQYRRPRPALVRPAG